MMNTGADVCVLMLDTSGDAGTVALVVNGTLQAVRMMERARDYAAVLNETIAETLAAGNVRMEDLTAVCVMAGPGSYTGLRIALSAAKGLCYALEIPLALQNGLQLLAEEARAAHPEFEAYLSILPARKSEYFFAAHNAGGTALVEPRHLRLEEATDVLDALPQKRFVTGEGTAASEIFPAGLPPILERTKSSTQTWLAAALTQLRTTAPADLAYAEPFYLKAAHTTTPKASR